MGGLGCVLWKVEKPSYHGTLEPRFPKKEGFWRRGIQAENNRCPGQRGVCLLISRNIQEPKVCKLVEEARGCRRAMWYGHCM